jgi:membrane protein DedA with SNARE-associated domain
MANLIGIFSLFNATYATLTYIIIHFGIAAVFGLMLLESASLPIPSEVVLPLVGLFAFKGDINVYLALLAAFLGSFIGMAIDYYIAYFLGKDFIYKKLQFFHIKKKTLEEFDEWFAINGSFTVFVSRLLPIVRTFINFPAGFAMMDKKKFFVYSMTGSIIWDTLLIAFGYYALSINNIVTVMSLTGVFAIILYIIYKVGIGQIKKRGKKYEL